MVIFDCNGVLVDGEMIAAQVAAAEFTRAGFPMTPQVVAHFFTGRRAIDMFEDVESATQRKLPADFATILAAATLRRFREGLRATPHIAYALTWLREPKCVASSSTRDRIRVMLETTGLIRYFEPNLFSGGDVRRGKPAPDLFLYAAAKMGGEAQQCVVVEDSSVGIAAAVSAGMIPIGFVGASHVHPHLRSELTAAGARAVIADMRALKSTILALRGW